MELIKEIECILTDLASFAKDNTFDIIIYEKYALSEAKAFNRIFPRLNNEDQEKVLKQIDTDFHLDLEIVLNMMGVTNINETSFKNRYGKLKRIFINHIQINIFQDQSVRVTEHKQNTILKDLELVAVSEISITDFIIRYKREIKESPNLILSDINLFLSDLNNYDLNREVEAVSDLFEMKLYKDRMELYQKHSKEIPKLEIPNPFMLIKKINNENYLDLPEYIKDIDFDALKNRPLERIKELGKAIEGLIPSQVESKINQPQQSKISKYKLTALHLIYIEVNVTNKNKDDLAKDHSLNSGTKLYNSYNAYCNPIDRKGDPGTKIKLRNKINLIECVIPSLPTEKQGKPTEEIKILKGLLETNY